MPELSKFDYKVLEYVSENAPCACLDVINAFDPQRRATETRDALVALEKKRLVGFSGRSRDPDSTVSVTALGRSALRARAERRPEKWTQWATVTIALLTLIATVVFGILALRR